MSAQLQENPCSRTLPQRNTTSRVSRRPATLSTDQHGYGSSSRPPSPLPHARTRGPSARDSGASDPPAPLPPGSPTLPSGKDASSERRYRMGACVSLASVPFRSSLPEQLSEEAMNWRVRGAPSSAGLRARDGAGDLPEPSPRTHRLVPSCLPRGRVLSS